MVIWPVISFLIFLPSLGALFIFITRANEGEDSLNARWVALWTSVITFFLSFLVWAYFDSSNASFQFVERYEWFDGLIDYYVGVDGIAILFVILTTFLIPICILASWNSIKEHVKEYMIAFMLLETMILGVFCSLDIVLFYLFFEGCLIPMFFIIGIWGGARRVYASFKFFLYTLLGSVLMLLAILVMYWETGATDIPFLLTYEFPEKLQIWLWIAFFFAFAVKVPMWPVHTWLPDAHVEAPTAGSVILAAVLLKMGGYGFLRFSLPMFPLASSDFAPFVFFLSLIAIIYTSLVALVQSDIKKLIAYSSIAHMGFVTMGLFSGNIQGIQGAIFQMLSHGLISAGLFLCVGIIYDRVHTREIDSYGGLVTRMPVYAFFLMLFTMANIGLPGTSGFIGEFLSLLGVFQVSGWVAAFAATGIVLSAAYALWLYARVVFGVLEKKKLIQINDVDWREIMTLAPLGFLTIFFGIYPRPILNFTAVSVSNLVEHYNSVMSISREMHLSLMTGL
ncbi:MAG: NADH-quinone oxidoreductase subunit M [Alphaproteobacteria bacterium]|nr:NADH-quinone oxidoreductase subunit M [Alphaproteobacteria bacterium]